MRRRRIKVWNEPAHYHCTTRVVGGAPLLGRREKEVLRKQMWKMADFCGLEILTYSIMSNHFHVLLHVPIVDPDLSDDELLRRIAVIYDPVRVAAVQAELRSIRRDAVRKEYLRRMGDISIFMKELKQRFSIWYNKANGRYGTLWAERFKSVLVQGEKHALATVAAYIDLNAVRAGLCRDPRDYRFSGYGEAVGGSTRARSGLCGVFQGADWRYVRNEYRVILFGKGAFSKAGEQAAIDWKHVEAVLAKGGRMSLEEALRCRVRYFTDGLVLGSDEFVRNLHKKIMSKSDLHEHKQSYGMGGAEWNGLVVMKRLRGPVFG